MCPKCAKLPLRIVMDDCISDASEEEVGQALTYAIEPSNDVCSMWRSYLLVVSQPMRPSLLVFRVFLQVDYQP